MNTPIEPIKLFDEKEALRVKYQEILNKFGETNRNLSLCKQFLEVLRDWDFNKIGATQVHRERVRNFLKNMEG